LDSSSKKTEANVQFLPGDSVEVLGLESENGKRLNGQLGVVTSYHSSKSRFEVRLTSGTSVNLLAENIRSIQFRLDECVEVYGITSEAEKELNGKIGVVSKYDSERSRFEVRFVPDLLVSLEPANLRTPAYSVKVGDVAPTSASAMKSSGHKQFSLSAAIRKVEAKRRAPRASAPSKLLPAGKLSVKTKTRAGAKSKAKAKAKLAGKAGKPKAKATGSVKSKSKATAKAAAKSKAKLEVATEVAETKMDA
jgi:hypothetical protein